MFESLSEIQSCLNLGKMVLHSLWLQSDSGRGMCSSSFYLFFYEAQKPVFAPSVDLVKDINKAAIVAKDVYFSFVNLVVGCNM